MKFLITLVVLIFTKITYACPQLAGNWKCLDEVNKPSYLEITQNDIHYVIKQKNSLSGALEVYADGVEHVENALIFSTKTTTTCNQVNSLNIVQNRRVLAEGLKSESHTTMDIIKSDDQSFTSKTITDTVFEGQAPQRGEQIYHCSKLAK